MLLIIVVGAGVFFWFYRRQQANQVVWETVRPERGSMTKTIEIGGAVTAKEYAHLRFAAGGKIVYLGAQEGDTVKKWQTIASIDQRSLRNSLQQNLNQYSKERLDWDQQKDDVKDRALPKEEERSVQKNQLDLNNSVLSVEATDIAITNTVLSAPFAGVLVSSPTNVTGVTLMATDVFELVNPASLIFLATIDELDIAQIENGLSAQIELDAYPDELIASAIQKISYKSVQTSSGTVYQVELSLPPQENLHRFRIGMNGDAIITLAEKDDVLSLPIEAITSRDNKNYVTVKTGEDTSEEREVEIGLETEDRVEILSGVTEADEVILPQ